MKIRPVILCGGAGTRLWTESKKNTPKQFIDFGGWNLFKKSLERTKNPNFDYPIISTNLKYLNSVKKNLKECNIKKYLVILEPIKKNTAPAILSSAIIKELPQHQPLMFFSADHLIAKNSFLIKSLNKHKKYLTNNNIFIFGNKPSHPSNEYGYFLTRKINKKTNKVTKFIEKPDIKKAISIIKKKGYWNSGMFLIRKDSIIKNFKKFQPSIYKSCVESVKKSKKIRNIYLLNKNAYKKADNKSFDYAILEKTNDINAIKLEIPWSDLGSWKEICKMYSNQKTKYLKNKYFKLKSTFIRPWGKYINLFKGKGFLVKEIIINQKGCLSLQKHFHRSEHWLITQGKPLITLNQKKFFKRTDESIFIPKGTIHRVENPSKKIVKIIEIQLGNILKETDIVRYKDIYGRVK